MPIFAGKNYLCQSGFYHGKNWFSAIWQKLANPALLWTTLVVPAGWIVTAMRCNFLVHVFGSKLCVMFRRLFGLGWVGFYVEWYCGSCILSVECFFLPWNHRVLQSFSGSELPVGDFHFSSVDTLLSKLPCEFTVDRFSRNGELCNALWTTCFWWRMHAETLWLVQRVTVY